MILLSKSSNPSKVLAWWVKWYCRNFSFIV